VDLHVPFESAPSIVTSTPLQICFVDLTNMDLSSKDLNRLCNRFRVLIIGRRNAGKTTILEKMTGSEVGAKPRIHDKAGRLVVRASPIYPTLMVKLMVIG
jgi:GTP-binding protein EngB required for normal cell division